MKLKVISKTPVSKNGWESYEKWSIGLADGSVIEDYGVVIYPTAWVTVIPKSTSGKFLLIYCHRPAVNAWGWEFPGGRLEIGETQAQASIRRLEQETGVLANEVVTLGFYYPLANHSNAKCFLTLTENVSGPIRVEPTLIQEARWFSSDEVNKMVKNNEIKEGSTIVAWLLYDQIQN